jgi:hypothetical protein
MIFLIHLSYKIILKGMRLLAKSRQNYVDDYQKLLLKNKLM